VWQQGKREEKSWHVNTAAAQSLLLLLLLLRAHCIAILCQVAKLTMDLMFRKDRTHKSGCRLLHIKTAPAVLARCA
jgi:hypothetical protein